MVYVLQELWIAAGTTQTALISLPDNGVSTWGSLAHAEVGKPGGWFGKLTVQVYYFFFRASLLHGVSALHTSVTCKLPTWCVTVQPPVLLAGPKQDLWSKWPPFRSLHFLHLNLIFLNSLQTWPDSSSQAPGSHFLLWVDWGGGGKAVGIQEKQLSGAQVPGHCQTSVLISVYSFAAGGNFLHQIGNKFAPCPQLHLFSQVFYSKKDHAPSQFHLEEF